MNWNQIWFDNADFKIKNAYRRYIAIHMMMEHPEIEEFCTTKRENVEIPEVLLGRFRTQTAADLRQDPVARMDIDKLLGSAG